MNKRKIGDSIQQFGRTLLLPIGVLAPIGMLLGISGALTQDYMVDKVPFLGNEAVNTILVSIKTISNVVFDNIPLLFAMGVAYGMGKKDKGISVFASVAGYLTLIVAMNVWLTITGTMADPEVMTQQGQINILGIQTVNISAAGGILTGLIAAWATERFYNLELPAALAFFSGKKSVPIITIGLMATVGMLLPFVWTYFVGLLTNLSTIFLSVVGPFFTAAGERLFIPFGLHHVWNALFRFTEAGGSYVIDGKTYVGVVPAITEILFNQGPNSEYWSMMPKLSRFMAQQQMLVVLFLFPAIAFAMYKAAYKENKAYVKSMLVTMVLTALLGNVTEPLEFTFVFLAPLLYIVYACIVGIGAVLLSLADVSIGYIRGTIFDFTIFGLLYENSRWIFLVLIGLGLAVVTYFIFYWAIIRFDIKTPGREELQNVDSTLLKEKRYDEIASKVVEALGGKENILNVDNCITRLRIDLKEVRDIDKELLNSTGCSGFFFPTAKHIHIVYGTQVEFIKNAVDEKV
ncbi:PTS transporter subunit EIIC [Shouchella clausii]|jgi:maltose/glucose PTS system EIICB component|uniref:PTS trehalose transporter subunit IIC n=1 Tax=Shouchella clausii TaxID=79880 RepID=A0A268RWY7_SHOCL|nr:PTS transporter subunit EIIC [Shouchella clausii]PAD41495.1 PTS trehalose transporter subunit IIC [Bacillus sp. 7520-S]SPU22411.1 PTS system, maltose/glucose-specific enzyme II, ABC component [Niallia circulans]AST97682.1 PTS trehalose transporter subunit IIC [Shouchella clausii]MBU8595023.1 PTS transporter subunit EIIC [Shouchella clausii]MCM3549393.1 PTS transporter subunit EIIC [Shouchella clausii]